MGHLILWGALTLLTLFGAWYGTSESMARKIRDLDPTQRANSLNRLRSPYLGALPAVLALVLMTWTVQGVFQAETRAFAYGGLALVAALAVLVQRRGARRLLRSFEEPTAEDQHDWERMRSTRRWVVALVALVVTQAVVTSLVGDDFGEMSRAGQVMLGVILLGCFVTAFGALFAWSSATASAPIRHRTDDDR